MSVCLTMGNMNARVSLRQCSPLRRCYLHRQHSLRQRGLFFCRLKEFISPVLASSSTIGNTVLQLPTMGFKSTSIIKLEFRYLCINKHCEIKTKEIICRSYIHHIFCVAFPYFLRKKLKSVHSTKVLKYYPIYTSSMQLLGMG